MTTDERLEKVEGQLARVRWFNRCLIACIVLSLGVWFIVKTLGPETAWAQSGAKEIRANKFVLEDENGKDRAKLLVDNKGTGLFIYDENGKTRALLSVFKDSPGLNLFDENGKLRAELMVFKDEPALQLNDENGKARVSLEVNKTIPSFVMFDENRKPIWKAP